jgi:hypothetical protein
VKRENEPTPSGLQRAWQYLAANVATSCSGRGNILQRPPQEYVFRPVTSAMGSSDWRKNSSKIQKKQAKCKFFLAFFLRNNN